MSILELEQPDGTPAVETFAARVVQPPYQVIHGSFLTVDAPVGATTLVVDDGADFDDSGEGGWLRLRLSADADVPDVYVEYVDWDGDETDVEYVTLAAPLAADVPAGTMVDVWDPIDVLPDSHWECLVVFDEPGATAFPVDVKQDVIDALPPETTLGKGQTVTLERAVGSDEIELVHAEGDLQRDGTKTPMTKHAFDRSEGLEPASLLAGDPNGARIEVKANEAGGFVRMVDANGVVRGILRVVIDETGKAVCTLASGTGGDATRLRSWVMDDGTRRIDAIVDQFISNGVIIGTNSLTLQLSPTLMKGFDGNSSVTRVLSNEGKTTVPHTVAGGGTVHCMLRGGNAHLFHVHADLVTGSEVRFEFRYRSNNEPAVNETVTFDWSITAYDRPTPVL